MNVFTFACFGNTVWLSVIMFLESLIISLQYYTNFHCDKVLVHHAIAIGIIVIYYMYRSELDIYFPFNDEPRCS